MAERDAHSNDNEDAAEDPADAERLAAILAYHEESKHRYDRMAPSLGYMDWANQPDPFRRYHGTETIPLPLMNEDPELAYEALFTAPAAPSAVTKASLGRVLELSLGLSAWKVSGPSRWALRMVPSSGNLHPTETYVIVSAAADIPAGIYHYDPRGHALETLARPPADLRPEFRDRFQAPGVWIALTSIFWRESWKYGLRAYRYCQLDMGHALAGLGLAARLADWQCRLVHGIGAEVLGRFLGLDRHRLPAPERERAECLCHLGPGSGHLPAAAAIPAVSPAGVEALAAGLSYRGRPNRLSGAHEHWHGIDTVARQAGTAVTAPGPQTGGQAPPNAPITPGRAAAVIRRRRSAVAYDPRRTMAQEVFEAILRRTLPSTAAPFSIAIAAPAVHLFIFVHRVDGLAPGIYALCRQPAHRERLKQACHPAFSWASAAPDLPLYLLKTGDYVYDAIHVSCDQAIAGYGAFSLGMLAYFHPRLRADAAAYRPLYWEAGLVGQLLYLEAEAQGFRGTGIGCYFDDGMHNLLGLKDREFQSLYHFTVGVPVPDRRLQTLPAYHHLTAAD